MNLIIAGKNVSHVEWIFLFEEDYLSDGIDEEINSGLAKTARNPRPTSMILPIGKQGIKMYINSQVS